MKFILILLMSFIVAKGVANADDLLNEINRLIHFINIQSDRTSIINQPRYITNFKPIINKAADRYDLDPLLIEAIIKVESNYNPYAVSRKGAMGLMQLMPTTAKKIGITKPFDPYQNIMAGTYYYRLMLERFRSHKKALLAYHCGVRCVENGKIPRESRKYANNVIRVYKNLKRKEKYYVK